MFRLALPSLALLALSALGLPLAAQAQSGNGCPSMNWTVPVELDEGNKGVVYDHSLSKTMLTAKFRHPGGRGQINGITHSSLSTGVGFEARSARMPDGTVCVKLTKVKVIFGFKEPQKVHIARDFAKGSCQYQVIEEHELQHVEFNRSTTRKYAGLARQAFTEAANHRAYPMRMRNMAFAEKAIMDSLSELLRFYASKRNEEASALNGTIDTEEAYAATGERCSGW